MLHWGRWEQGGCVLAWASCTSNLSIGLPPYWDNLVIRAQKPSVVQHLDQNCPANLARFKMLEILSSSFCSYLHLINHMRNLW